MQPPQQPGADVAPAQAPPPPVSITTVGPDGKAQTLIIPRSEADVHQLLMQREQLSEQLTSVASRRSSLAAEIRQTSDPALRTGLEERLRLLDQRILQLETDLATTGRQISSAPADLTTAGTMMYQSGGGGGDFEEGLMIGGFSVLFFMSVVFFFARRRWKRRGAALPSGLGVESQRLERLENGMEAIAIEIERVSEGQRFVTRLLSESQSPLGTSHRTGQPAGVENDPSKR